MKIQVRIFAQYLENYAFDNEGNLSDTPHWKSKGGVEFILEADDDLFMYMEKECIEVINKLLEEKSNKACKYKYVDHQLIFHKPVELDSDKFAAYLALADALNKGFKP